VTFNSHGYFVDEAKVSPIVIDFKTFQFPTIKSETKMAPQHSTFSLLKIELRINNTAEQHVNCVLLYNSTQQHNIQQNGIEERHENDTWE